MQQNSQVQAKVKGVKKDDEELQAQFVKSLVGAFTQNYIMHEHKRKGPYEEGDTWSPLQVVQRMIKKEGDQEKVQMIKQFKIKALAQVDEEIKYVQSQQISQSGKDNFVNARKLNNILAEMGLSLIQDQRLLWRVLNHASLLKKNYKEFSVHREFDILGQKLLKYALCQGYLKNYLVDNQSKPNQDQLHSVQKFITFFSSQEMLNFIAIYLGFDQLLIDHNQKVENVHEQKQREMIENFKQGKGKYEANQVFDLLELEYCDENNEKTLYSLFMAIFLDCVDAQGTNIEQASDIVYNFMEKFILLFKDFLKDKNDYKSKLDLMFIENAYMKDLQLTHHEIFEEVKGEKEGDQMFVIWKLQSIMIRKLSIREGDRKILQRAYKDIYLFFKEANKKYEEKCQSKKDCFTYLEFIKKFKNKYSRANSQANEVVKQKQYTRIYEQSQDDDESQIIDMNEAIMPQNNQQSIKNQPQNQQMPNGGQAIEVVQYKTKQGPTSVRNVNIEQVLKKEEVDHDYNSDSHVEG